MKFNLDQLEVQVMQSYIRQDLRKQDKKVASLTKKFGDDADLAQVNARTQWLEKFYRKMGGKVENISNRRQ